MRRVKAAGGGSGATRSKQHTAGNGLPLSFDQMCDQAFELSEKAGRYTGEKGFRQYARAAELYEEALRLRPSSVSALYNCGHVLYTQSRLSSSAKQERSLLLKSIEKFEAVLQHDDRHLHALYNVAIAICGLADLESEHSSTESQQAAELYSSACRRFQQLHDILYSKPALELPPEAESQSAAPAATGETRTDAEVGLIDDPIELPDVLAEWAETLAKRAALLPAPAACPLFRAAYEKFEQLRAMPQRSPEAMVAYASALLSEADAPGCAEAAARVDQAVDVLTRTVAAHPRLVDAHTALADAQLARATHVKPRLPALETAAVGFQRAHAAFLKEALPTQVGAAVLAKWADCLLELAKEQRALRDEVAADATLRQAEERYRKALQGLAREDEDERAAVRYNLACALALSARATECQLLLAQLQREHSAALDELATDPDFASVASLPWFQTLLSTIQHK